MRVRVDKANASALELVERVMGSPGKAPVAQEQPLALGARFGGLQVCVEEDHPRAPVISTCSLLVRDLVMPEARLRLGLIGSVATDPAQRGRGLATTALKTAERELAQRGCMASFLWADQAQFYEARGYRAAATEVDWFLPLGSAQALPEPSSVRPGRPGDAAAVHALYERHDRRVLRTREETAALLGSPGMRWLVRTAVEPEQEVVAYGCLGRGRDLAGVVHEWGGAAVDVLALVRALLESSSGAEDSPGLFLMSPPASDEIAELLEAAQATSLVGVLGMAKILRTDLACMSIRAAAQGPAPALVRSAAGRPKLSGPSGSVELDESTLFSLLLAAQGERLVVDRIEQAIGVSLPGLPLSPFLWGLDSI